VTKASFTSQLFKKEGNVWDTAIYVPKTEAEPFIDKDNKRVICTINGSFSFHAGLMPQGNGDSFINVNGEIIKKLRLEVNGTVEISLEKDTSTYGMPLPDELKTAWELDPEGYDIFHTLTMGKQRSLVHIISKPKSSHIRIKKALTILEYLKTVNGNLDYKELNEAIKLANKK
jgi:hypothetical protein